MENSHRLPENASDNWADYPSHLDMQPCLLCDKTTQSHAIYLKYRPPVNPESEAGLFIPVETRDEADNLQPVCHSCYQDVDGDAVEVAIRYRDQIRETTEPLGITFDEFVNEAFTTKEREQRINESSDSLSAIPNLTVGDFILVNDGGPYLVSHQSGPSEYLLAGSPDAGELGKNLTEDDLSRYLLRRTDDQIILQELNEGPKRYEVVDSIEYESDVVRAFGPNV